MRLFRANETINTNENNRRQSIDFQHFCVNFETVYVEKFESETGNWVDQRKLKTKKFAELNNETLSLFLRFEHNTARYKMPYYGENL